MKFLRSLFRKRRKNEGLLRYAAYLLHLWLGLFSGLIVMLMCATGCLYAFKNQILEWDNRELIYIKTEHLGAQGLENIQNQFAGEHRKITAIIIPADGNRSYLISSQKNGVDETVYYDPFKSKILGSPNVRSSQFFETVLDLHRNLLLGDVGRQIVGVSVLIFCIISISGIILWFPKKWKYLRQALTVKKTSNRARLNHDLHNTLGFYTCIFLFFIAITGLYITYPWMKNALIVSLGGESITTQTSGKNNDDTFDALLSEMLDRQNEKSEAQDQINLDQLLVSVNKILPYFGTTGITFPDEENPRYTVIKTNTDNFLGMQLSDELSFDQTGKIKTRQLFADLPLNKKFTQLAKPLHTGEIMGLKSIIFYFTVCLIGFFLPVTGFFIWLHRFRKLK